MIEDVADCLVHVADMAIAHGVDVDIVNGTEKLILEGSRDVFELSPLSCVFGVTADDSTGGGGIGSGRDGRVLARVGWFNKSCGGDGGVGGRGENETEVAMVAAAKSCWNGSGIGFELVFQFF